MYVLTMICKDYDGMVTVSVCGVFDELDDARRQMASEYHDAYKEESEFFDGITGEFGDWDAVVHSQFCDTHLVILDHNYNRSYEL